jgi:hypothetical protein
LERSKCNHKTSKGSEVGVGPWGPGFYKAFCGICQKNGPSTRVAKEAEDLFWKEVESEKGESMYVPSDPHEAYKMGVKQATATLYLGYQDATVTVGQVNEKLEERRKSLLTKKVTKWATLIRWGSGAILSVNPLSDTKVEAENKGYLRNEEFVGVYPIEIELPL